MMRYQFLLRAHCACAIALLTCLDARAELAPAKQVADFIACATPHWPQGVQGIAPKGKVDLHILIAKSGRVESARVARPSTSDVLDQAALNAVKDCRLPTMDEQREATQWYPIQWSWSQDGAAGTWRLSASTPYEEAPPGMRAFFLEARQADAIADPLQRCLRYPDMPGNQWPAGLATAYCHLSYGKKTTLSQVAELVGRGAMGELETLYRGHLHQHFSKTDSSESIHYDFNLFDGSDQAASITRTWLDKAPRSAFAIAARAQHLLSLAGDVRGGRYVADTPPENMQRMGVLASQAGDLFGQALKREKRLLPAYIGLIDVARLTGQDALGDEAFARANALDPGCRKLSRDRMRAMEPRWGGSEAAMAAYASQLAPLVATHPLVALSTIMPALDQGELLLARKMYRQSASVLEQALRVAPFPDLGIRQAQAMMADRDYSWRPLLPLLVAYRYDVADFGAARARGDTLLQLNDPQWALKSLQRAVTVKPDDAYAQSKLDEAKRAMLFRPVTPL
ncbi:MAG: TonB family protein [Pseudomonadota bacterium]